jgi:hypothetical protein
MGVVCTVLQLRAETATHYIAMAFDEDLNVAEVRESGQRNSRCEFCLSVVPELSGVAWRI